MSVQDVLPSQINYAERPPSLVECKNLTQKLAPVNGSSFTAGSQIIWDFPSRGFIDGKSIYISYKCDLAGLTSDAAATGVCGAPAYAPFQRLDIFFNNQLVDTIQDYNVIANIFTNTQMSVADKYGVQYAYGYADATPGAVTLDELDGRVVVSATTASYYVSVPLVDCLLSSADKFIPAFAMGNIRVVLTLEPTASNFVSQTAGTSATVSISNAELTYDLIDFGSQVEADVLSMDKLLIKSASVANSSVSLASGATGQQTLVFNQRLKSIRNAIVHASGGKSSSITNGKFDAINVVSSGTYQIVCGGMCYPQGSPINLALNPAAALMELRKATGALMDWSKGMSINTQEFGIKAGDTTTLTQPGKAYIGFDLNKINSSSNLLLNGTSSTDSPINLVLNVGATTSVSYNVSLVLHYDALIHIDPKARQVVVEY